MAPNHCPLSNIRGLISRYSTKVALLLIISDSPESTYTAKKLQRLVALIFRRSFPLVCPPEVGSLGNSIKESISCKCRLT